MGKRKIPRKMSIVKQRDYIGIEDDSLFIFLGEIKNMRGHCVVVGYKTGKTYSGFHIENFFEVSEDEV